MGGLQGGAHRDLQAKGTLDLLEVRQKAKADSYEIPNWFQAAAQSGLIWHEQLGIGVCLEPAPPKLYSLQYWTTYIRLDHTPMGEKLTEARIEFVRRFYPGPWDLLCDVGVGGGRFVKQTGCKGYDINPFGAEWLIERGAWHDPNLEPIECLTFWDSLEHDLDWPELDKCKRFAFISLPIYDSAREWLRSKHYKPGEHRIYFSGRGLVWFMKQHGFVLAGCETFEMRLGREAITTFAFSRAQEPSA